MRAGTAMLAVLVVSVALLCGCGSGGNGDNMTPPSQPQAAPPTITTNPAQNGAVIVSLASTTAGATIYYSVDGTSPTPSSQQYQTPFLVAANLTVKAIATASSAA